MHHILYRVIVALLTTDFEIAFLIAMAMTILAMTRSVTCKTANGKIIPCDQCDISAESANTKCKGFEVRAMNENQEKTG